MTDKTAYDQKEQCSRRKEDMSKAQQLIFIADGSTRPHGSGIGVSISNGLDAKPFQQISEWLPRFEAPTVEMIAMLRSIQIADKLLSEGTADSATIYSDGLWPLEAIWAGGRRGSMRLEPMGDKALRKILEIARARKQITLKFRERAHQAEADALAKDGSNKYKGAALECALSTTGLLTQDVLQDSMRWSALLLRHKRNEEIYPRLAQVPTEIYITPEQALVLLLKESQWDINRLRTTLFTMKGVDDKTLIWQKDFVWGAMTGPTSSTWWLENLLYQLRTITHGFVIDTSPVLEGQPRNIIYKLNVSDAEAKGLLKILNTFGYKFAVGLEEFLGATFCLELIRTGYIEVDDLSPNGPARRMRLHPELFACTTVQACGGSPSARLGLSALSVKPTTKTWDEVIAETFRSEPPPREDTQPTHAQGTWHLHFTIDEAKAFLEISADGSPYEEVVQSLGSEAYDFFSDSGHLREADNRVFLIQDKLAEAYCYVYPPIGMHLVPSIRAKQATAQASKASQSWRHRLITAIRRAEARTAELAAEIEHMQDPQEFVDAICGCGHVIHAARAVFQNSRIRCSKCNKTFAPSDTKSTTIMRVPEQAIELESNTALRQTIPQKDAHLPKNFQIRLDMAEAEALHRAASAAPEDIAGILGERLLGHLCAQGCATQQGNMVHFESNKMNYASFNILTDHEFSVPRFALLANSSGQSAKIGWEIRLRKSIEGARKNNRPRDEKKIRLDQQFTISKSFAKALISVAELGPVVEGEMANCLGVELMVLFHVHGYMQDGKINRFALKRTKWQVLDDTSYRYVATDKYHAELVDGPEVLEIHWLNDLRAQVESTEVPAAPTEVSSLPEFTREQLLYLIWTYGTSQRVKYDDIPTFLLDDPTAEIFLRREIESGEYLQRRKHGTASFYYWLKQPPEFPELDYIRDIED